MARRRVKCTHISFENTFYLDVEEILCMAFVCVAIKKLKQNFCFIFQFFTIYTFFLQRQTTNTILTFFWITFFFFFFFLFVNRQYFFLNRQPFAWNIASHMHCHHHFRSRVLLIDVNENTFYNVSSPRICIPKRLSVMTTEISHYIWCGKRHFSQWFILYLLAIVTDVC